MHSRDSSAGLPQRLLCNFEPDQPVMLFRPAKVRCEGLQRYCFWVRVLVTGGGGLLARYLVDSTGDDLEWFSTSRSKVESDARVELLDLTDFPALSRLLNSVRPEAIVNAAAEGSVDAVQARPDVFYPLNVEVPKVLAKYCRDHELPLVHVSSNAVFGSDPGPYDDDSPFGPVNAYGLLKCQAEEAVRLVYPEASILRPIQMYGWPRSGRRPNLASAWIGQLRRHQPIKVVDDVVSEPLWAADTADAVRRLIREPVRGPVNISGGEAMTLFEFARLVAQQFELDDALIAPVPSHSFTSLAPRPSDTRFTLRRLRDEVGIHPLPTRLGLSEMRSEEVRATVRGQSV